jgi:3-oxoacyl-[acyl-carrier-protein] synthase-3
VIRSVVQGCGAYLPERVVTNAELSKEGRDVRRVDRRQRTGIRQRHIAAEGEFTSHLAIKASQRALDHAGITAADLDLIVLATATPDHTFPATATRVQAALGMTKGALRVRRAGGLRRLRLRPVGRRQPDPERPGLPRW